MFSYSLCKIDDFVVKLTNRMKHRIDSHIVIYDYNFKNVKYFLKK